MSCNDSALSSEYAVSCNFFSCSEFEYFLAKILKRQSFRLVFFVFFCFFCLFDIRGINIKIKQMFQGFFCVCVTKTFIAFYRWTQPSDSNSYKVSHNIQLIHYH